MSSYKCIRCGFVTNHKNNFRKHIYRKYSCGPKLSNVPISDIRETFENNSLLLIEQNNDQLALIGSKKKMECFNCHKRFSRLDSLTRHMKNYCKVNDQMLGYVKENYELKQKIEEMIIQMSKINNVTNTTNIIKVNCDNQINNTIVVNNFGNENLDFMNNNVFQKVVKSKKGIPKLIEYIHFNPEHPENHNIRITNKKLKYGEIKKDNNGFSKNKKDILTDLIENGLISLEEYRDNNEEKLNKIILERYNQLANNYELNKEDVYQDTELAVLNCTKKMNI